MKTISLTTLTFVFYFLLSNFLPFDKSGLVKNTPLASERAETISVTALTAPNDVADFNMDAVAVEDQQLEAFAATVVNGQPGQVVGVYVPGVFALPVLQQPQGEINYVSTQDNTVTQFGSPSAYGSTGLLAHNYLSGKRFFELVENQDVIVVHGDGHRDYFRINKIQRYQALTPYSPSSDFVDLNDPSQTVITAGELFNRVYTAPDQVVFQTCIEANGDPSWGRIFITAERIR